MRVWRIEIKNEKTGKEETRYGKQGLLFSYTSDLPSVVGKVLEAYEDSIPIGELADADGGYTIKVALVEANREVP